MRCHPKKKLTTCLTAGLILSLETTFQAFGHVFLNFLETFSRFPISKTCAAGSQLPVATFRFQRKALSTQRLTLPVNNLWFDLDTMKTAQWHRRRLWSVPYSELMEHDWFQCLLTVKIQQIWPHALENKSKPRFICPKHLRMWDRNWPSVFPTMVTSAQQYPTTRLIASDHDTAPAKQMHLSQQPCRRSSQLWPRETRVFWRIHE